MALSKQQELLKRQMLREHPEAVLVMQDGEFVDMAETPTFRKGQRVRISQARHLQAQGLCEQIGTVATVHTAPSVEGCDVRLDDGRIVWIAANGLKPGLIL